MVPGEEADNGHGNAPGIRKPCRRFGECEKEQTVEIRGIAWLQGEDRRRYPLPDGFTNNYEARRGADQRTHKDVTRIVEASIDPPQQYVRGKRGEEQAAPLRYQPKARRDRKEKSRIVAREAAPVLEVRVPLEGRRIGSDAEHRAIAKWQ